jgi:3-hydroxyacyl-CoA dehydrogenase
MIASKFFTTAARRSFSSSTTMAKEIKKIGVVGMGSMGHGIVQLSAQSGYEVVAVDLEQKVIDHAMGAINGSLDKLEAKGKLNCTADEARANITTSTDIGAAAEDCDLIIEAIIENLPIKLDFYKQLGGLTSSGQILASNTSSFSITEMAEASGRPEDVVGLHYFNPVQIMKLVEVVSTEHTLQSNVDSVTAYVERTGKVGVPCGDTPGFIVNRLLVPYIVQGVAMVARGDAKADDIDLAMQLGAGYPMGPITLSDYVGNDINLAVMKGWLEKFPNDPAFQVPEAMVLLEEMVANNKLGRKTGEGFFKWEGNKRL